MAETWLINESITSVLSYNTINFISNNTNCVGIETAQPTPFGTYALDYYYFEGPPTPQPQSFHVYNGDVWTDQAYRTVTFETSPTGDLLTWLQANAVKQQSNITLDLSTIGLTPGTHSIQMKLSDDGITKADSSLSNSVTYVVPEPLPQLDAPTNLTADGTTISFDEVENAESYEVFADGNSIGEFTPQAPTFYNLDVSYDNRRVDYVLCASDENGTNAEILTSPYKVPVDKPFVLVQNSNLDNNELVTSTGSVIF